MNQKNKKTETESSAKLMLALLIIAAASFTSLSIVSADPSGATVLTNVTETAPLASPDSRTDPGGTITTMVLDVIQQNPNWKAYVGNISGSLTLDDSDGNTIFDWAMSNVDITGEIYSTRTNSVDWSVLNCSNETVITTEDTALGFSSAGVDTINKTFNETTHQQVVVAGRTLPADQCRSTALYVNSTAQAQGSADFQQILFASGSDLVYASPLNQGAMSYDENQTVDFQLMLADDVTTAITTYYFFVELG